MKTLKFFMLLSVFCFTATRLYSQESEAALLNDFKASTEKWKHAYNSGDAQNLAPLYAEDAVYVSSHVPGLEANGLKNIVSYFQGGIDLGGHIDSIEVLKMQVSCDMATLLCKYRATNSGVTVEGRNLLVMKKQDGKWLIVTHMTVV